MSRIAAVYFFFRLVDFADSDFDGRVAFAKVRPALCCTWVAVTSRGQERLRLTSSRGRRWYFLDGSLLRGTPLPRSVEFQTVSFARSENCSPPCLHRRDALLCVNRLSYLNLGMSAIEYQPSAQKLTGRREPPEHRRLTRNSRAWP